MAAERGQLVNLSRNPTVRWHARAGLALPASAPRPGKAADRGAPRRDWPIPGYVFNLVGYLTQATRTDRRSGTRSTSPPALALRVSGA